jgi:hypothetical protein
MANRESGTGNAGRRVVLAAGFLLFPISHSAFATGYDFPAKQWPDMVARLQVRVADEPDAAGFARVHLTVDVEGPPTLQVEPPTVADALDAWKIGRASSWHLDGDKARWETTMDLRQVKAGLVPIPSVKVRCRASPTAPWEEAEWTDILTDLHGLPLPAVAPAPLSGGWSWAWVAVVAVGLLFLACVVVWRRGRRAVPPAPSLEEKALAELRQLENGPVANAREFALSLSMLVRRYVAVRFGLPAPRQTTAEFLEACRMTPEVTLEVREQLRGFLERCDLVKFAGISPSAEERADMLRFVGAFIVTSARPAGPTRQSDAPTTT